ncbi:MAG TPA: hypothetical protein VJ673_17115 [Aromatoleum sp.]|uniref:hypothetical protein n=1 Tax=Aromatoleum sp. TaxID=2307007 RepID=UPI002B48C7B1|nr:hypothetical protein [Aromatoleum sp.]HJV27412.1 hypothetical protein [Aromatoleum sp.]
MRSGLAGQRLAAVFALAAVLFNYPVLSLFDRAEPFFGMPMLWLSLFVIWVLTIVIVAWIAERGPR